MAENTDVIAREILYSRNAVRWVAKTMDIPLGKLFVQWVIKTGPDTFKAMIKLTGTEIYYEVTCLGGDSGYDIITYERMGITHGK